MTDKAKLQQLFEAALKDSSEPTEGRPHRAFPAPSYHPKAAPAPASDSTPKATSTPDAPVATAVPAVPVAPAAVRNEPAVSPAIQTPIPVAPEIDAAASEEMNAILDEKARKAKRSHRLQAVLTAALLLAGAGGGTAWFIQSPARIQAMHEAVRDIRSVGDAKTMAAKYQDSLDRVAVRGSQLDEASAAMGVTPAASDNEDPYFNAEMKQMMRSEGKTLGERNSAVSQQLANKIRPDGKALSKNNAF